MEIVMSTIRLASIFRNGAVLQRNKEVHIWGFSTEGSCIKASFAGHTREVTANDKGRFDVVFPAMDKGGPYTLTVTDANGGGDESSGIMIGDVILISGQSNMEYPMEGVRETYPSEWDDPTDPMIRAFKITENGVFGRDIEDVETGEWKSLCAETINGFSAVGFFTAKHIRKEEDVAVGLVDVSLGGAPIEAFMSEDMLQGFDDALTEAAQFSDDDYREKVLAANEKNAEEWNKKLDDNDAGVKGHYEDGKDILANGRPICLPDFFSDTELAGYTGSLWIARTFTVPAEYVKKSASVWFGSIVDFDHCYINGEHIGYTEMMYIPRRYPVPAGLLREGENTIVFRIGVEKGYGRVTPGKLYGIVFGSGRRTTDGFYEGIEGADHVIPLSGIWRYLEGYRSAPSPEMVFVNWKATALYHGMLAPLAGFAVKAFVFYQGESNCARFDEYKSLTERFIKGLRSLWGYDMPYICVQLPEFNARMEEDSYDGGKGWRGLMAAQEDCSDIPGFYLVRSYGSGELNDIHPQRKEPVGEGIAAAIRTLD